MISEIVKKQRLFYQTNETKTYEYRRDALLKLKSAVLKYEKEIASALYEDLHKSEFESYMSETGVVLAEIEYVLKHLKKWMRPKKVKTPLVLFKASSYQYPEPFGVVLIMSPWNYPFQLAIDPLVGAIAAGNTAVIKPASYAKNTSLIIEKLIQDTFPEQYITTVLGGRNENQELLEQHFDYIFFTGSTNVGKLVMEKASKYLTPISLELGGKSPCIIHDTNNMKLVARRVAFGKFLNGGQTCVAPDYVFIKPELKDEFIKYIQNEITSFFGEKPLESKELPKIINEKHKERLLGLIQGENIAIGGNALNNTIEPTVLIDINGDSKVMQEEIFGPILPILTFNEIEEVYHYVNSHAKPLALYLFTQNSKLEKEVFNRLSFGGATVNDTIMHFASSDIGFGGVGDSGMGKYHGKSSFDTFSNIRGVLKRSMIIDLNMRYHPYTEKKSKLMRKFLK